MKAVQQTRFGYPDGNCHAACLASIFEIGIDEVPYFGIDDEWYDRFTDFMITRFGLQPIDLDVETFDRSEWALVGYHLINGKSPRGDFHHSIVGLGGEPIHDPYPGGDCELSTRETYTVFISTLLGTDNRD